MSFDYTGSFSGSFYGVISSSAQVNYGQIQNKPITITAFQRNSITANNNFRETTWPFHSSSFDARIKALSISSGSLITISGSDLYGNQIDNQFVSLRFDSNTGLHVTSSDGLVAEVSIGSHFRDIIVSGSTTLVATGSDQLEIIAGDGMLIDTSLVDTNGNSVTKELSFRLDTSSQHFIDAVTNIAGNGGGSGIFAPTGSVQSTTNDLEVTGSMTIHNGLFKLSEFQTLPTAEAGAIVYSSSQFWFGVD